MESYKDFIKRTDEKFRNNLELYDKTRNDRYLRWFPDINRKGKYGCLREAWTFMVQYNIEEKIFIIEKFKTVKIIEPVTHEKIKKGEIEYRFGYYMVGKNGNRINKWTWGQSCPIIPQEDFSKLIKKAREEETIIY